MSVEDLAILLITLIIYLVSGVVSRKKKRSASTRRTGHRGPMRTQAQGERHDPRAAERTRETEKGFAEAFGQREQHTACEERPLHLHEVTQTAFSLAEEGEDPCHAGGVYEHGFGGAATQLESDAEELDANKAEENAIAQDILRGVIMSEILTRPRERMAAQRSRR